MLTSSHCSVESIYNHLHTHTNTRAHTRTGDLPSLYPFIPLFHHLLSLPPLYSSLFLLSFLPLLSIHTTSPCFFCFVFKPTLIYRFPLTASCCTVYVLLCLPLPFPSHALHLFALFVFFASCPLLSLFRGGEERHCLKPKEEKNSKIRQQHERWADRTWTWVWKREVKSLWDKSERGSEIWCEQSAWTSWMRRFSAMYAFQIWLPKKELSQIKDCSPKTNNSISCFRKCPKTTCIYPLVMQPSSDLITHDGSKGGGEVTHLVSLTRICSQTLIMCLLL